MNKKEARLEVINLLDNNCKECEYRYSQNSSYCWKECEIGKRLNALGTLLGGKMAEVGHKEQERERWDMICKEVVKLRIKKMKYIDIAKHFNVSTGCLREQLKKRT